MSHLRYPGQSVTTSLLGIRAIMSETDLCKDLSVDLVPTEKEDPVKESVAADTIVKEEVSKDEKEIKSDEPKVTEKSPVEGDTNVEDFDEGEPVKPKPPRSVAGLYDYVYLLKLLHFSPIFII